MLRISSILPLCFALSFFPRILILLAKLTSFDVMTFDIVIFSLSFVVLYLAYDLLQLPYEFNMIFLSFFFWLIFPFLCFPKIHWVFSISVLNLVMLWVPFRFKLCVCVKYTMCNCVLNTQCSTVCSSYFYDWRLHHFHRFLFLSVFNLLPWTSFLLYLGVVFSLNMPYLLPQVFFPFICRYLSTTWTSPKKRRKKQLNSY